MWTKRGHIADAGRVVEVTQERKRNTTGDGAVRELSLVRRSLGVTITKYQISYHGLEAVRASKDSAPSLNHFAQPRLGKVGRDFYRLCLWWFMDPVRTRDQSALRGSLQAVCSRCLRLHEKQYNYTCSLTERPSWLEKYKKAFCANDCVVCT